MQSLSNLNTRAATALAFTENRGTNVIFDRAAGKTYSFTETSLTFNNIVGANIVEIINPSIANVRFQINLGAAQATISYNTLPTGVTVNKVGSIYTFYGIDSVSDYDAIKQVTINIDAAYSGSFSYSGAIVYNTDSQANVQFEWNVGIYIPDAQLTAVSSLSCDPTYFFGGIADITSFFGLAVEGVRVLGTEFQLEVYAKRIARTGATIDTNATLSAKPRQYLFNDSTFNIDNPNPQRDSHLFGNTLAWDGSNIVIGSLSRDLEHSMYAVNATNGDTEFSFDRIGVAGTPATSSCDILGYNNNYVLVVEGTGTDNADDHIVLWKKQATGDLYTKIDNIGYADPSGGSGGAGVSIQNAGSSTTVTDSYIIHVDTLYGYEFIYNWGLGRVRVYSIDDSSGLTLEYDHIGVSDSTFAVPRRQNLGQNGIAICEDYYAMTERYDYNDSTAGSWHKIYVYDTATGTLQYTLNGSSSQKEPQSLAMYDNNLYITYDDNTLEVFDMDTGSTTSTITLDVGGIGLNYIREYDATFLQIGNSLYNRTNGHLEASPGVGVFLSTQKLAQGDVSYDVNGQVLTVGTYGAADVTRLAGTYTVSTGSSNSSAADLIVGTYTIVVDGTGAAEVTAIVDPGRNNAAGDIITIADSLLGNAGADDWTFVVASTFDRTDQGRIQIGTET